MAVTCARIADDRKGTDISVIEVARILPITDYFVLITCANARHLQTLAQEMHKLLKGKGISVPRIEGTGIGWWKLLDMGSVVVHLFEEKARAYYDMDNLLADAETIDWRRVEEKGPAGQK